MRPSLGKNHSCETEVVNVCDNFINSLDGGEFVIAMFLDLRRAFKTVSRDILIQKMYNTGLNHIGSLRGRSEGMT